MQYKKEQFIKDSKLVKGSTFTVPPKYASLEIGCFEDAPFKEIILPNGIKTIPRDCFYNSQIESITLPDTVVHIKNSAFGKCKKLKNVTFSKSLMHIDDVAFYGTTNLGYLELPDTVVYIGNQCFLSSGVKEIKFGKGLEVLGCQAFKNCCNLNILDFTDTKLTYFAQELFSYSKNLKALYLPRHFSQNATWNISFVQLFERANIEKIYKPDHLEMPKILKSYDIKIVNFSEINIDDLIKLNKSYKEMNTIFKNIENNKEETDETRPI